MATQVRHDSFLVHRNFRFLKLALLTLLISVGLYIFWVPVRGSHNGGTALGYGLGTLGALIILWLMLFGLRKRRYGPGAFSLKGWLSAHVYLGLALIVIATLHTGFQFGWNIHTLAYALMITVILTGIYGVVAYGRLPGLMTENRQSVTTDMMLRDVLALDRRCAELSMKLPDAYVLEVKRSREQTRLGGSLWRQLRGSDRGCGTTRALERVQKLADAAAPAERNQVDDLVATLGRKQEVLRRLRRDMRYKALLDVWLYLHVPLSFALLAALTAHVISVFFYW